MKLLKLSTSTLAMALFICFSVVAQSEIDQTFSGINEIEVSTGSSDCVIKKGSGSDVRVQLDHTYGDKFRPTVEKSGSKLVIRESHNNGSNRGEGTWTLTVPDGIELDFNTGSGDFQAAGLEIELSLNAGSGDFSLRAIKGDIDSNTGSGDLEVENLTGELTANAGSGDMAVSEASGAVS